MNSPRVVIGLAVMASGLVLMLFSTGSVESRTREGTGVALETSPTQNDPTKMLGVARANCKKCHPAETAAWMKTAHYSSTEKLLRFTGNTLKYAEALGIRAEELMTTSLCADCHGTKALVNDRIEVISGVSCESCHGPSGGDDGWLNRHQSYHPERPATRGEETEAHRIERLADCDAAGMIRSSDIPGIVRNCLSCHIVAHDALVAAGHKAYSNFEFNAWTAGEVRHNYFLDQARNEDAPSLWLEQTGSTAAQRHRLKFIAGTLTSLEVALRNRAELTNPAVIPQLGGFAAALNGKLAQINAVGGTPETREAAALFAPMLGTIFAPLATDKKTYSEAADKIAELTTRFLENNEVDKLDALDAILSTTPPHFSQQFKERSNP